MIRTVTCPICGTQFETNRPNKKYCSPTCKEEGRQQQLMKWAEEHPHYSTEYMREYRERKKAIIGARENKYSSK